ncbi:hypothetical protein M0802_007336 [Mischocyttarus mexicanus]|nr:hypothetical protein M0802_007336 [Mischocyttarus mexicanus]
MVSGSVVDELGRWRRAGPCQVGTRRVKRTEYRQRQREREREPVQRILDRTPVTGIRDGTLENDLGEHDICQPCDFKLHNRALVPTSPSSSYGVLEYVIASKLDCLCKTINNVSYISDLVPKLQ